MKAEILARVRAAIGKPVGNMPPEDVPIARAYRQSGTLDTEARLAQFVSRLEDYNSGIYRCTPQELPETVADAMDARGKTNLVIPPEIPTAWLPVRHEFTRDINLSPEELDRAQGVLTGCTAAISLTGSIVLSAAPNEGRRALTLIPDYHLCVVFADQLVETVPEGIRVLRAIRHRPITTISGPSATADIEMIRVKGVHGPRFLDVIIAGDNG